MGTHSWLAVPIQPSGTHADSMARAEQDVSRKIRKETSGSNNDSAIDKLLPVTVLSGFLGSGAKLDSAARSVAGFHHHKRACMTSCESSDRSESKNKLSHAGAKLHLHHRLSESQRTSSSVGVCVLSLGSVYSVSL